MEKDRIHRISPDAGKALDDLNDPSTADERIMEIYLGYNMPGMVSPLAWLAARDPRIGAELLSQGIQAQRIEFASNPAAILYLCENPWNEDFRDDNWTENFLRFACFLNESGFDFCQLAITNAVQHGMESDYLAAVRFVYDLLSNKTSNERTSYSNTSLLKNRKYFTEIAKGILRKEGAMQWHGEEKWDEFFRTAVLFERGKSMIPSRFYDFLEELQFPHLRLLAESAFHVLAGVKFANQNLVRTSEIHRTVAEEFFPRIDMTQCLRTVFEGSHGEDSTMWVHHKRNLWLYYAEDRFGPGS